MTTLEDLYYGNISPHERYIKRGSKADQLVKLLGHTNASFTLDTYTHVTTDMQQRASNIVGGFMSDIFGEELKS